MRGPLPLNEADFAEVRANVLARIERRRRAPWGELAALAASVVVTVVSVVVARQPIVVGRSAPHVVVVNAAPLTPTPILRSAQDDGPRTIRHREHKKPVPQLARIEIHTADPDIRIIWINRQEAP